MTVPNGKTLTITDSTGSGFLVPGKTTPDIVVEAGGTLKVENQLRINWNVENSGTVEGGNYGNDFTNNSGATIQGSESCKTTIVALKNAGTLVSSNVTVDRMLVESYAEFNTAVDSSAVNGVKLTKNPTDTDNQKGSYTPAIYSNGGQDFTIDLNGFDFGTETSVINVPNENSQRNLTIRNSDSKNQDCSFGMDIYLAGRLSKLVLQPVTDTWKDFKLTGAVSATEDGDNIDAFVLNSQKVAKVAVKSVYQLKNVIGDLDTDWAGLTEIRLDDDFDGGTGFDPTPWTITKSLTIDLNGYSLKLKTSKGPSSLVIGGSTGTTVTLKNSGTNESALLAYRDTNATAASQLIVNAGNTLKVESGVNIYARMENNGTIEGGSFQADETAIPTGCTAEAYVLNNSKIKGTSGNRVQIAQLENKGTVDYVSATTMLVGDAEALKEALQSSTCVTIKLTGDIACTTILVANHDVTLDLAGKTLSLKERLDIGYKLTVKNGGKVTGAGNLCVQGDYARLYADTNVEFECKVIAGMNNTSRIQLGGGKYTEVEAASCNILSDESEGQVTHIKLLKMSDSNVEIVDATVDMLQIISYEQFNKAVNNNNIGGVQLLSSPTDDENLKPFYTLYKDFTIDLNNFLFGSAEKDSTITVNEKILSITGAKQARVLSARTSSWRVRAPEWCFPARPA